MGVSKRMVVVVAAVSLMSLTGAFPAVGRPPAESVASTTAAAIPEVESGWLPVDLVKHPLNPVYSAGAEHSSQRLADRIFPTAMRVDDKLAAPLDGHRWYLWLWRHGQEPRTPDNGGRLALLTADSLEGPWTDRGFVTPRTMSPPGWNRYGWTGGDVVWSARHRKFFSVPHVARDGSSIEYPPPGLDSFLMESADGVNWQLSAVPQPVLRAGPQSYDRVQTGYGKLLRIDGPGGSERWVWLYRSHAVEGEQGVTLSVATAGDIYGPWEKATDNPVFDPLAPEGQDGGGLIGIGGFVCYQGYYQLLWGDSLGAYRLSRSKDLRSWETFAAFAAGDSRPFGKENGAAVFTQGVPHEVVISGGDLVFDPDVGALTFVYTGWDAQNFAAAVRGTPPGRATVNIARSLSGGVPLRDGASSKPSTLDGACS